MGIGFYITTDYAAAVEFAKAAVAAVGGYPFVVYTFVSHFDQLNGREVGPEMWWRIADDSAFITDYDYLTSSVFGYDDVRQLKFNPRAFPALAVEVPR